MVIAIESVKVWFLDTGIGHIVQSVDIAGTWTLCGSLYFGTRDTQKDRPGRVCRECRKRLASPKCKQLD